MTRLVWLQLLRSFFRAGTGHVLAVLHTPSRETQYMTL